MRVLFITSSYPSSRAPYNGVFVRDHAKALLDKGVPVAVLAPRVFREDAVNADDSGVNVRRFRFWSAQKLLAEYTTIPVVRMLTYLLSGARAGVLSCRRWRPSVVHGQWVIPTGLIAVLVGKYLCRLPVVVTAHRLDVEIALSGSRPARILAGFTLLHADHVVAVSSALRDRLVGEFGLDVAKVDVIAMGVDTELFVPRSRRQAARDLDLPARARIVLFVGGLTEVKGVRDLVNALPGVLSEWPDAVLVLAGQGPLEENLRRQAAELGVDGAVMFVGSVNHEAVADWMNAADVLVLPSRSEGLPVCLMEAAAAGLPVVATDVGGSAQVVVLGEHSVLVAPGRVDEITAAVIRVLAVKQPDVREPDMTNDSAFSVTSVTRRLVEIYERLASG